MLMGRGCGDDGHDLDRVARSLPHMSYELRLDLFGHRPVRSLYKALYLESHIYETEQFAGSTQHRTACTRVF